jgi:hypothetical protein
MRPQAEDTHPVAKKMLMNLRPGAPRAGKLLMLLSANRTAHELAITRLLKPVLKYCSCIMLVCVFSAATRVAESPFAGSWKLIGDAPAELALKNDGTGILRLPDRKKALLLTW